MVAFSTFISGWENQMGVRAFLADEVAPLPGWVRVSYDFFDRFLRLISATDLVEGAVCSLPALLVPLMRLHHFRRYGTGAPGFLYAAFNVAYSSLAMMATNHRFGAEQIVAAYLWLGSYLLLLLVHFFVNPTAVGTALWPSEKQNLMTKVSNG